MESKLLNYRDLGSFLRISSAGMGYYTASDFTDALNVFAESESILGPKTIERWFKNEAKPSPPAMQQICKLYENRRIFVTNHADDVYDHFLKLRYDVTDVNLVQSGEMLGCFRDPNTQSFNSIYRRSLISVLDAKNASDIADIISH